MAESKDARRTRLKNEGKALIAAGRHDEVTPQHQAAMDYFVRKNAAKGARDKMANAEKQTDPNSPREIAKAANEYIPSGTAIVTGQREDRSTFGEGSAMVGKARTLNNYPRAINEDNTHHASMATIADHLGAKLDEAHDSGRLHASDAVHIDQQLTVGHQHLERSNNAHERGDVEAAKHHMIQAADAYYGAASQMQGKGIVLHKSGANVGGMAKDIAKDYAHSNIPGYGAAPHEAFKAPRKRHTVEGATKVDQELTQKDQEEESLTPEQKSARLDELEKSFTNVPEQKLNRPRIQPVSREDRKDWENRQKFAKNQGLDEKRIVTARGGVPRDARSEIQEHARIALQALRAGQSVPAKTRTVLGRPGMASVQKRHDEWKMTASAPSEEEYTGSDSRNDSFNTGRGI